MFLSLESFNAVVIVLFNLVGNQRFSMSGKGVSTVPASEWIKCRHDRCKRRFSTLKKLFRHERQTQHYCGSKKTNTCVACRLLKAPTRQTAQHSRFEASTKSSLISTQTGSNSTTCEEDFWQHAQQIHYPCFSQVEFDNKLAHLKYLVKEEFHYNRRAKRRINKEKRALIQLHLGQRLGASTAVGILGLFIGFRILAALSALREQLEMQEELERSEGMELVS